METTILGHEMEDLGKYTLTLQFISFHLNYWGAGGKALDVSLAVLMESLEGKNCGWVAGEALMGWLGFD